MSWRLSSHVEFLGVLSSNFVIFNLCDTLQRVNSVGQLPRYIEVL